MPSLFPEPDQPLVPELRTSPSTVVHAHCDGGARGNPGPAGFGAVLVDDKGETLAELSEFLGVRTNNYAEYAGLLASLQWTLDHGYRRLSVISDSKLMVMQIQGKFQVKSPDLRPLWAEARRRISQLSHFEIGHALRHKNKVADRLANEAMDRGMGRAPGKLGATAAAQVPSQRAAEMGTVSPPEPPRAAASPRPPAAPVKDAPRMLRGFTRDGAVHLLGGATLPDGIFVKVVPE